VDRVKITEKGCKPAPALLMPSPEPNIAFGAILTLAAARGLIVANIDCAPADRRDRSIGGVVERMMSLAGRIVRDDRTGPRSRRKRRRPSAKAIVDRRRRPVDGRAILPPTAGLQNMNDAADDLPVVGPSRRPGLVLGQQRHKGSPSRFAQPKLPAMIQASNPIWLDITDR
jgi:hypothetical protein